MVAPSPAQHCLTVTEVNRALKRALEERYPEISFEGEISQVKRPASGHLYLVIKDATSSLEAVIWLGVARTLNFTLEPGLTVQCSARPDIWHVSGKLQLNIFRIVPSGEGFLRKKFEELRARLEREGLFAAERKRPLPFLPAAIGIITSREGAVVHDIMVRLQDRLPQVRKYLVDVRVQGPGAAEEIAEAVRFLGESGLVDVMIVGRGGGSLQDLWAFNEEIVVRAIFAARVPVISAVGHEVDVTLADFAADVRAPTPTAAAEMVVPRRTDLMRQVDEYERRLGDTERWFLPLAQSVDELSFRLERSRSAALDSRRLTLQAAGARLRAIEPGERIRSLYDRLQLLGGRLYGAGVRRLNGAAREIDALGAGLRQAGSPERLALLGARVDLAARRLESGIQSRRQRDRHNLDRLAARLESASPARIMERGYSIVESGGRVVRSAAELKVRDQISIRLYRGRAQATVTATGVEGDEGG